MYKKNKITVIIPALNEEKSLPDVIKHIPYYIDRIIIADNGSTDKTSEIAKDKSLHPNLFHCNEPKRGYGSTCLNGMKYLQDEDIIVFLDADNSDDASKINLLLDPIIDENYDVVISNRFTHNLEKHAMSFQQLFGNKLAVFLIKLFWGYKYKDLGPFRSIKYNSLKLLKMNDKNFGWTVELQIKAIQKKFKINQADVPYRCRRKGKSKIGKTVIGTILAGYKILSTIFSYKIKEIFSK